MPPRKKKTAAADEVDVQALAAALQKPFLELDAQYNTLWDACTTPAQKQHLKNQRDALLIAYAAAQKIGLEPGNSVVADLSDQLDTVNEQIEGELADLTNIVNTLKFLDEVVKIAAAIAALVV